MELYRGWNIHGHCHRGGPDQLQNCPEWKSYYNAIVEFNDYRPVPMQEILATLRRREEEK